MYIGKTQNPGMLLLLSIVTCGVYAIYYFYTMICDVNQLAGREVINPILGALVYPYGWYMVDQELIAINTKEGVAYKSNFILWAVLTPACGAGIHVAAYQLSTALNKIWEKRSGGASAS